MPPRPSTSALALRPSTRSYATINNVLPGLKIKSPKTQPPSLKPAQFRKTQLLRQYASLLHSTPLSLIFQHNNLSSQEWSGIRRELSAALQKVDAAQAAARPDAPYLPQANAVKIQIVQTGIFAAALPLVEHYDASKVAEGEASHVLSRAAHEQVTQLKKASASAIAPLLSGPIALLTFPSVSPAHLKAALSILVPRKDDFPAPTRRASPGWHDPPVQTGLQKLMLMGARVEGKVFDSEGARWVGGIEGGLDGLRAQVVHMLQAIGGGVTQALEAHSKSIYLTLEGRRMQLDEEANPKVEEVTEEAKPEEAKA